MQNIHFHIAYLLTRHECVIVPGLGAFVVSPSNREKTGRWSIPFPPESLLGFNSEIKHNDGLLANSIMKEKKCSYREANLLIEQYVIDVVHSLGERGIVHLPWVGSLHLDSNKQLFQPERVLSCNAFNYGFSSFSLPLAKDIQQEATVSHIKKDKEVIWIPINRKLIVYAASVAAALIAACFIPTTLNKGNFNSPPSQYASLIQFSNQAPVSKVTDISEIEIQTQAKSIVAPIKTPAPLSETATFNAPKATFPHYYIIIASLPNQTLAEKSLAEFQSEGFENAAILSADGRHRIYINCFEDKMEADKFLLQFRKAHPLHANAWLLKQK